MKITQEIVSKIIKVNSLLRKEFGERQFVEFGLADGNDVGLEVTVVKNGTMAYRSLPSDLVEKETSEIFDYIVGVV